MKIGGSKEDYLLAKKCAKRAVYNAKKLKALKTQFTKINTEKDCNKIFKLAKKVRVDKYAKDKDNNLVPEDKEKVPV